MHERTSFTLLASLLALAWTAPAHAGGGASIVEQGTPRNGVASAGSAAFADDASTSFFNPAGMARLDRSQFMVGTQLVKTKLRFDIDEKTDMFMGGNDGGDGGGWAYGMSNYYVHTFGERWRAGVSLTAPVAGGIDYDNDWIGRYYVTEVDLLSLNLNPAVSYKVNDWLSLGAGVNVAYMTMDFTFKLPNVASIAVPTAVRERIQQAADATDFAPAERFLESAASMVPDPQPAPDGKLKLDDLDDFAVGWNLGVLAEPWQGTRIGLTYRSEMDFDLGGDFDTGGVGPVLTSLGLTSGSAESEFDVPQIAVLSLYQQVTEPLAVLIDVMWTDWSVFEYTPIKLGTPAGAALNIPRDWKDTWRFALGVEYRLRPAWVLQAGFSYDTSPIRSSKDALPDLPITEIFKFSLGFKHELNDRMTIGVNYMYADLGSSAVDFEAIGGRLKGDFKRNDLHQVGFSLNWRANE